MDVIDSNTQQTCTACGATVPEKAFFCPNCGTPVGSKAGRHYHQGTHYTDYGYRPMHTESLALISLLVSIFGFFFTGFIGPLIGVILGHIALNRINRSDGQLHGRGMAIAALVIGYCGLFLGLILMIVLGTFVGLAVGSGGFWLPWWCN